MGTELADPIESPPMHPTDSAVVRIGVWRVDPAVDEIARDGQPVKLERRAMQTLMCLAQAKGQPVSVEELLDRVWAGLVVTPDSVYQAVASLRRALDDDPRAPAYIASVPRRGYRLVAQVTPWVDAPVSPAGKPEVALSVARPTLRTRRILTALVFCALGIGILGYVVLNREGRSRSAPAEVRAKTLPALVGDKSIAVLPFVDMSATHDQEYFSDGLSEEIIDHLGRRRDLRVIARTSSFQFKGKNEDVRAIGQQLGVAHLLEGSVRTSGEALRVTAQLIRVSDGSQQWSAAYDAKTGDIFKVQEAIATSVAASLGSAITPVHSESEGAKPGLPAYDAFLRGKYFVQHATKEDMQRAIGAFKEAIRLEPTYAAAWARLADAYNLQGVWGWTRPASVYGPARAAVDRALALNPNLALAHAVLSDLEWNYQYDFAASRREELLAQQLDPGLADYSGNNSAAAEADLNGDLQQSIVELEKAVQDDPLDSSLQMDLAVGLLWADRTEESERVIRALIELQPGSDGSHAVLAEILRAEGRSDAALAEAQREPDEASRLAAYADVLWTAGRHAESDARLRELQSRFADTNALAITDCYGLRGDKDAAFKWLERAIRNREPAVTTMRVDSYLKSLHGDPRWTTALHNINLRE